MSVRTDVINLQVNVQGNQAQNQMNDLRKKAADLRFEMDGLRKGTQAYIDKKNELAQVTAEMNRLKMQIGLTALTQKELTQELTRLRALKGSMQPFTDEFRAMEQQIRAVENRLFEVRNGVQGFSAFFSRISDQVKQFGALAAGYLGFQFITQQFQNIIAGAGRLSDKLADVQRVSGLTAGEVANLRNELAKVDTRTSVEGLLNVAIIAGKLGVAKGDILDFTKAVDMLVVSLGDELGDADQITTQLGKILNVFEGKITGDNITHLGNAIVDLANKGVASGPFLVDFAQRVAGIAKTANLSLASVLGLAAGLEESGARVESSSTAIQKLLTDIASDLPKAAKIAGEPLEQFNALFAKAPQEALLQYAAGLQKNKQSFAEVAATFKDAGEDGARTVAVLATMGQKTDFFRQKMQDAGGAISQTNEITEAFNLKNQTFGATLDKLGKEFNALVNSGGVSGFLKGAVEGLADFIGWLRDLPNWLERNRTLLIALTGVVLTYVAAKTKATQAIILNRLATLLELAADKLEAAQLIVTTAITKAYGVAKDVLTGKIKLATVAQQIWNTVIKANPLAALVLVVTAAATAISYFASKVKDLTAAQKLNADIQQRAADATSDELNKIQTLTAVISDHNVSYDNKRKALQALIALNPTYLNGLTLENINTQEGKKILDGYISSLKEKAELEAKQSLLSDKLKERNAVFTKIKENPAFANASDEELTDIANNFKNIINSGDKRAAGVGSLITGGSLFGDGIDLAALKENVTQIKILQTDLTNAAKKNVESVLNGTSAAVTQSNVRTIDSIKQQLKDLEDAYVKIDVTNTAALKANAAKRKALQDELDSIEGKQNKSFENSLGAFKDFLKSITDFIATTDIPEQAKKIIVVLQKTRDELGKLDDFKNKGVITTAQYLDTQLKIYEQQRRAIQGLADEEAKGFKANTLVNDSSLGKDLLGNAIDKLPEKDKPTLPVAIDFRVSDKQLKELADKLKHLSEKLNRDLLAGDQVAVNSARGFGARTDALLAQLKDEHDLELKNSDLTNNERIVKEQEYQQKRMQVVVQALEEEVAFAQDVYNTLSAFEQAKTSKENGILNRELRANDLRKQSYKKQLDSKLISEAQYNKKVAELDADSDAKKEAIAKKQFERNKKFQMAQAAISGAQAVLKTLSDFGPPIPPNFLGIAAMALTAGTTIAEELAIARTEYSGSPSLGDGDWIRKGDKHSDPSGGIPVMIERDEAVMSAAAMTDDSQYTVTGTPAQITSALNSMNGGASWMGGASVQPGWRMERPAMINPNMARIMASGGMVGGGTAASFDASETNELLRQLIAEGKANTEEIKNMKTRLHAVVSIKEYRIEEKKYDAAKKASSVG